MTPYEIPFTIRRTKRELTIIRGEKVLLETVSLLPGYGNTPEDAIETAIVELAHDDPRLDAFAHEEDEYEIEFQIAVDDVAGRFEVFAGDLVEIPEGAAPLAVDGDLPDGLPIRTMDDLAAVGTAAQARIDAVPAGDTLIDTIPEADWTAPDPDGRIEVGTPARPEA